MNRLLKAFAVAALLLMPNVAAAQTWPARPIKLIVPTGPGLATDIMARLLADGVTKNLGQPIVVENMPGASGIVGAQAAARAAPDGYTLFFANASALTSNMVMIKSIPYDPARDFSAVAMVCNSGPFVVVVTPGLPVKSLPELIAYGKANPGKLSYAVDATSGFGMVAGKLLNKRSNLGMVEVPYRATAQMLQDLAVGTVSVAISTVAPTEGFAKAGKLRRIAITSEKRFPGLDDLPAVGETLPQFVIDGWFAVVAPAGTPPEIVRRLNQEIDPFLKRDDIRQRLRSFGLATTGAGTPESTAAFIRGEQERWRGLARELDLQPQ
jgi:tripartite-type tricarboxylate transporter receptor subunit TctC